mgnify:CR=1 FL=1
MEKLPVHSKEGYGDTLGQANKSDRRDRPTTTTYLCRIGVIALLFIGYLLLLRPSSPRCTSIAPQTESYQAEAQEEHDNYDAHQTPEETKIPLEAHIMSKCPDAQACLQKLVLPAMEKISEKVDFKLSFIAR